MCTDDECGFCGWTDWEHHPDCPYYPDPDALDLEPKPLREDCSECGWTDGEHAPDCLEEYQEDPSKFWEEYPKVQGLGIIRIGQ